jgi:hypothetical protein
VVILYRRFGRTYKSNFQGSRTYWTLKIGPIGCPATSVQNYLFLRCVTSQKSADFFHIATEAWNHA